MLMMSLEFFVFSGGCYYHLYVSFCFFGMDVGGMMRVMDRCTLTMVGLRYSDKVKDSCHML